MTPTNEPSTEGRVCVAGKKFPFCEGLPVTEPSFICNACGKVEDLQTEITTLTDALTEARAALNRSLEASSIAESGRLNAEAEIERLRTRIGLRCPACIARHEAEAQSILKDAPEG